MVGTCGSSVGESELEDAEEECDFDDEEEIEVASGFAPVDNEGGTMMPSNSGLEEDTGEVVDASALFAPSPNQTRKRTHRDETPSEEERVERGAFKSEAKKTRTGLREYHQRQRPKYLDDYVTNINLCNARVLDKNGRPIRASQVKIPRNRREMLRSKWRELFLMAELEEMAALKAKGVIMEIPGEDVPPDAKPVKTMWVYALKSDHEGFVIRFKARIVALGNYQRPDIDFHETFAPVARMSSFRLLMAIAAE